MARVAGGAAAAGLPAIPSSVLEVCSPDGSFYTGGFFADLESDPAVRRRSEWTRYKSGKAAFWRDFDRVSTTSGLMVGDAWRRTVGAAGRTTPGSPGNSLPVNKRDAWVFAGAVGVSAAVSGGLVGWFVRGNWTADWVSAAGSWVGALGTVGAIVWAVHSFRLERAAGVQERIDERTAIRQRELGVARGVLFECRGGGGYGNGPHFMNSVDLKVTNGTSELVELIKFDCYDGVEPPAMRGSMVVKSQDSWTQLSQVDPPRECQQSELSQGELKSIRPPTLTYRFGGIVWQRAPGKEPERIED